MAESGCPLVGGLIMIGIGVAILVFRTKLYDLERWLSGAPHEYRAGRVRRAWDVGCAVVFIGIGVASLAVWCVKHWR